MSNILANALSLFAIQEASKQLQFWGIASNYLVWTAYKQSPDSYSNWSSLQPFNLVPLPPLNLVRLVGGPLSDGRIQLFALVSNGQIMTAYQNAVNSPLPPNWTFWTSFPLPPSSSSALDIAVFQAYDGTLQVWMVDNQNQLWYTIRPQVTSPGDWSPWTAFTMGGVKATKVIISYLSDGLGAVAVVDINGKLWAAQQTPFLTWTSLVTFPAYGTDGLTVLQVAVGKWSDGRLQLWAIGSDHLLYTSWQTSSDSNAKWTMWASMTNTPDSTSVTANLVTVGSLSDGRFQLWIVNTQGTLQTCWTSDLTGYDYTVWVDAFPGQ